MQYHWHRNIRGAEEQLFLGHCVKRSPLLHPKPCQEDGFDQTDWATRQKVKSAEEENIALKPIDWAANNLMSMLVLWKFATMGSEWFIHIQWPQVYQTILNRAGGSHGNSQFFAM